MMVLMSIKKTLTVMALCTSGAVASVLAQSSKVPTAPSAANAPTFSKDVAPIFYKNCTSCHRPGEIAPMSLLTYQDARPWARSIATRVASGTMPPWHADPAHGEFENDRRLSDGERDAIARWVSAGAPEGNPSDLPARPTYTEGWMIGQPDAIITMQEDYPIPAKGTLAYKYFEVPTNFTEDKWVQGFEVRPGNRAVVHHVIVYARPPARPQPAEAAQTETRAAPAPRPTPVFSFAEGMEIPGGQTGGPELPPDQRSVAANDRPAPKQAGPSVGAYVPGNSNRTYAEGTALRLRAGSTIVFQMHYTPSGTDTTDRTSIGLIFAKAPPKIELRGAVLANGSLHIPAGASDYRVEADMTINQDVTLWSILPHTHVRGKRWSYQATYPDGRTETILAVPNYDFDWQTDYIFKQPLKLPKGTKLHASAWYDNSPGNKANPDPTKEVWWGDQTWEEMMFTGLTVSIDPARPAPTVQDR
jgi:mono/diheme cytochrome c family protein